MLTLVELLTSVAGFGLLAATSDLQQQGRALSLAARVFAGILRTIGSAGLVTSGVLSIIDFGWRLGLVAWIGWLASGALAGVALLALMASRGRPRPRRPGSPDHASSQRSHNARLSD